MTLTGILQFTIEYYRSIGWTREGQVITRFVCTNPPPEMNHSSAMIHFKTRNKCMHQQQCILSMVIKLFLSIALALICHKCRRLQQSINTCQDDSSIFLAF